MGLIEFWTSGLLIMIGVTYWARQMKKKPGAPGFLGWLVWVPGAAWALSTTISAFFLWRSGQLQELGADQRTLHMARNLTWSMYVALVGAGLVTLTALFLGLLTLLKSGSKKAPKGKRGRS